MCIRDRATTKKAAPAKKAATKKTAGGKKAAASKPSGHGGERGGKLVVVESPAKAKTIGRYLGRGYVVKPSLGHVRDLLKSRLSVDVDNDFAPEYRVPNEKRALVKELKEAAARADEIFLATDPDREGEAIAWHVREAAEMDPARTKRVVFQEITQPAIRAAFAQPRAIDMDRVEAQQARRVIDRLVGYQLSPLLWRKVQGRLSAGRVQSVAVRLVVEREREIEAFDSREYWTIGAELSQTKFRAVAGNNGSRRPFFIGRLHRLNGAEPELGSEEAVQPHVAALQQAHWQVGEVNPVSYTHLDVYKRQDQGHQGPRPAHRDAAGGRRHDRPGSGARGHGLPSGGVADRPDHDQDRRRRPRRRGHLHARSHRLSLIHI